MAHCYAELSNMELRTLAEQVLFATTLEEKLRCPAVVTDAHPGTAVPAPSVPGRPTELRFKSQSGGRSEFPGLNRLDEPGQRGRLLHFFANHELLATELMALVLLRFPEAPAAFRRGILQTLKDEQQHTRWYLERMRQCGVQFGELPVSGYFWRAVSGMESPLDYVAGLSLTFEQANLDFARQFSLGFAEAGDAETAQLLDRIYRDEIGHVAYGLKWFRRWKNPQASDWEAFCQQLKFPLSPQRAKGVVWNPDGRKAAGLDPAFIQQLSVFSQSKGRTPGVFLFNPHEEGHLARGKTYTPGKLQAQLARDLENLPQFLCRKDDLVLVHRRPATAFLDRLKRAGFELPEFVELDPTGRLPLESLLPRKLNGLHPWAWGPTSVELLSPLSGQCSGGQRPATECFDGGIAQLYSKAWSAAFLREFLSKQSDRAPWLCRDDEVGKPATGLAQAMDEIHRIRAGGHHRIVVKQAHGLAGQAAIRLWEPDVLPAQIAWLERGLQQGGTLVAEPWLERVIDFSMQLEMDRRGLQLIGFTGLINDIRGQFQGNWAAPNYRRRLPNAIAACFPGIPDMSLQLHNLFEDIRGRLERELAGIGFLGPLGVDAFVYRDAEGRCRLKPVVEINPRYTMGRLTLELMRHACPGTHGLFQLVNQSTAKRAGHATLLDYARAGETRQPVKLEGQPVARLREGVVCLNDPETAVSCLAVFTVGPAGLIEAAGSRTD